MSASSNIKVKGVSVKDFHKKIICHAYLLFLSLRIEQLKQ